MYFTVNTSGRKSMAEVILFGEPMALFAAEEPGSLMEVTGFTRMMSGAEVNVAAGLTRLGHPVTYVTRLGTDPMGKYLAGKLREYGIGAVIKEDPVHPTGIQFKNRVETGDPETAYFRKGSAASCLSVKDAEEVDFTGIRILHLTGILPALSKSCLETVWYLIQRAKEEGIFFSFDPNLRPALWKNEAVMVETVNQIASQADLVLPGIQEGKVLAGSDNPREIAAFYRRMGVGSVIVKMGDKGAYGEWGDEKCFMEGIKVDRVEDTVGAGDGFAAGVLSGILEGLSFREILLRGNAVGAVQVTVRSDNEGLPTREELMNFIKERK